METENAGGVRFSEVEKLLLYPVRTLPAPVGYQTEQGPMAVAVGAAA